jgi:hypothetical protein
LASYWPGVMYPGWTPGMKEAAGAGAAADLVVGVTAPASGFRAHAWLDGDQVDPQFMELWRYPAGRPGPDGPRRGA